MAAASTSQAPDSVSRSCKPQPPYNIEMVSTGDSQWTLTLRNSSNQRDAVVWMWSEIDATGTQRNRQQIWSGTLAPQELQSLRIKYQPTANAVRVWAALESPDNLQAGPDTPTLRGLAVTPWNVPASRDGQKTAQLTEDPATGRRVIQYVGQGGLQ